MAKKKTDTKHLDELYDSYTAQRIRNGLRIVYLESLPFGDEIIKSVREDAYQLMLNHYPNDETGKNKVLIFEKKLIEEIEQFYNLIFFILPESEFELNHEEQALWDSTQQPIKLKECEKRMLKLGKMITKRYFTEFNGLKRNNKSFIDYMRFKMCSSLIIPELLSIEIELLRRLGSDEFNISKLDAIKLFRDGYWKMNEKKRRDSDIEKDFSGLRSERIKVESAFDILGEKYNRSPAAIRKILYPPKK